MEAEVILKNLEDSFEKLPVDVPSYEIETYSQFEEDLPLKKNVSFSEQSSILYFGKEDTPDTLQNSSSVMFNHFDESVPSYNNTPAISHPIADAVVVIEKLPQTLLDEYIKKKITYEEFAQKVGLQTSDQNVIKHCHSGISHNEVVIENSSNSDCITVEHNKSLSEDVFTTSCSITNEIEFHVRELEVITSHSITNEIEFPVRELEVLIHRLPDNLLEAHWNHTNSHISLKNDIARIPSGTACLEYSETMPCHVFETGSCAFKQVNHKTECPKKKKSRKVKRFNFSSSKEQKRYLKRKMKEKTKNIEQLNFSDKLHASNAMPKIQNYTRMKEMENNQKVGFENHSSENLVADVFDSQECLRNELTSDNKNQSKLIQSLTSSSNSYTQLERSNFTSCKIVPSAKENTGEHPSMSSSEASSKLLLDSGTLVTPRESSLLNTFHEEDSSAIPSFTSTQEPFTEGSTNNQTLSDPFKKRLCVHLEKLALNMPETYSAALKETNEVKRSIKDYFPVLSSSKKSISKSKTSYTGIKSHSKSSVKKDKNSQNVNSQSCVTFDTSSDDDDDVPLELLAKINLTKQKVLQTKSNKKLSKKARLSKNCQQLDSENLARLSYLKTFNYIDSSTSSSSLNKNLHNESSKDLVSDDSSEENFPLSHFSGTSQSTSIKEEGKNILSNCKLSDSTRSPLRKVMLDHSYNLPPDTDDDKPVISSSAPLTPKKKSCALSSNVELQSLIAKTKQHMKKINKQNARTLKNKKLDNKILVNSALQNGDLPSKLLKALITKNKANNKISKKKLTHKKKKCDKKTLRRKQAKVYDMMIKYLQKEIKVKSKKKKKKKTQKDKNLVEQSEKTLPELSKVKVEPESECEEVERNAKHNESANSSFGSESTIEASPEPSRLVDVSHSSSDSSTNKLQVKTKDKYRLGFLSKNRSLRFYNACIAQLRLYNCNLKKKQRRKLKKLFNQLKKVCPVEKNK